MLLRRHHFADTGLLCHAQAVKKFVGRGYDPADAPIPLYRFRSFGNVLHSAVCRCVYSYRVVGVVTPPYETSIRAVIFLSPGEYNVAHTMG